MTATLSALLLAWLGAASAAEFNRSEVPTDMTRSNLTCFSQSVPRRDSFFGRATAPIRLEMRGWDSHVLVSRMAEILLREKLGFDVEVQKFSSGAYIYTRIAQGIVDLNVEAWPGVYHPSPLLRPLPRCHRPVTTTRTHAQQAALAMLILFAALAAPTLLAAACGKSRQASRCGRSQLPTHPRVA
jgi:hypothetical protein